MSCRRQCLVAVIYTLGAMRAAYCTAAEIDGGYEFDVGRGGDLIVLPVRVCRETYAFLVDTGSTVCCLHDRHRSIAGKKIGSRETRTPGGSQARQLYAAPDMYLGNIALRTSGEVLCVDLADIEEMAGVAIDGILGMDALRHLVLVLDFDHGKVRVTKTVANPTGTRVALIWHGWHGPFVATQIVGRLPCEFLIDTGAMRHNFGSLDPTAFGLLEKMGQLRPLSGSYSYFSLGQKAETRLGRLHSITLARFQHAEVLVERVPFWNSLGIGFLARYICAFDFPNNVLYLEPGERFARRDAIDASGLDLRRFQGEIVVDRVVKGDLAELAGIRARDVLLTIDGESIDGWSIFRIEARCFSAGAHLLTLRRDGSVHTIKLRVGGGEENDQESPSENRKQPQGRIKLYLDGDKQWKGLMSGGTEGGQAQFPKQEVEKGRK